TYAGKCVAYEYWHLTGLRKLAIKVQENTKAAELKMILDSSRYDIVRAEISRAEAAPTVKRSRKAGKHRIESWRELWNGPHTVEQLAKVTGDGPDYGFYRQSSNHLHGGAAIFR